MMQGSKKIEWVLHLLELSHVLDVVTICLVLLEHVGIWSTDVLFVNQRTKNPIESTNVDND